MGEKGLFIDKALLSIAGVPANALFDKTKRLLVSSRKIILVPFIIVFLLFIGITSLRVVFNYPSAVLLKEPMFIAQQPFYYGLMSNLGIMIWTAAAAVNFLGAALLQVDRRKFLFLLISGIFTILIALDDMLMFHEVVFPKYLHIREYIFYLGYFFAIFAYLLYFRKDILSYTNFVLLIVALAGFASSVLIDAIWDIPYIEDGAKFFGIVIWAAYFFESIKTMISERMITDRS